MDQVQLLTAVIEASIALLGFSGLVIAVGRRASGEWSPVEKLRLTLLLGVGLLLLACTILALTLLSAQLSQAAVWALSSAAWVVFGLPIFVWAFSSALRLIDSPSVAARYRNGVAAVAVALTAIQVTNAISLQEFWPFFAALGVTLIVGVTQFLRLFWFGLFR